MPSDEVTLRRKATRYRVRVEFVTDAKNREDAVSDVEFHISCGSANLCESPVISSEVTGTEEIR